jgi:hypothetical protein
MEEGRSPIVEVNGHKYYVLGQDLSKGDRRSDGRALSDFFNVEAASSTVNNVRESHRIRKKRELATSSNGDSREGSGLGGLVVGNCDLTLLQQRPNDETCRNPKVYNGRQQNNKGDGYATSLANVMLCGPQAGIRCAGRNDTTRLLWLHEFYVVHEGTRSKGHNYIYQAVNFMMGEHVPAGEVGNMSDRMRRSIWVQGRCHLPAEHVRKFSKRNKGYMFHTELNDGDGRTALLGSCPEVVRVENWLQWHQMRCVSTLVPRVVHAEDVQIRRVHVAGRENHFVCGVSAVHDFDTQNFSLALLPRSSFCMYPEEKLGMELNSPSMMWEHIDDIFHKIRICMSCGRQGTTSATFTIPLLNTVFQFWQVSQYYCIACHR